VGNTVHKLIHIASAFGGPEDWFDVPPNSLSASSPNFAVAIEAVLRRGLAFLCDLSRLMRAFVGGVSVVPDEARLDVQMRTLPAIGALGASNSACGRFAAGPVNKKPARSGFPGGAL
jgi:hypothetical protein